MFEPSDNPHIETYLDELYQKLDEKEFHFEPSNSLHESIKNIPKCDEQRFNITSMINDIADLTPSHFEIDDGNIRSMLSFWNSSLSDELDQVKISAISALSVPTLTLKNPLVNYVKPILFEDLWNEVKKLNDKEDFNISKMNCQQTL